MCMEAMLLAEDRASERTKLVEAGKCERAWADARAQRRVDVSVRISHWVMGRLQEGLGSCDAPAHCFAVTPVAALFPKAALAPRAHGPRPPCSHRALTPATVACHDVCPDQNLTSSSYSFHKELFCCLFGAQISKGVLIFLS